MLLKITIFNLFKPGPFFSHFKFKVLVNVLGEKTDLDRKINVFL